MTARGNMRLRARGDRKGENRDMLRRWFAGCIAAAGIGGALALSGCVETAVGAGATTAIAAASEKGVGGAVDDVTIRATINKLWLEQDFNLWHDVGLTVDEGRVLLTGKVEKPEARVEAVRLAWRAKGVKEVINEIKVTDEGGLGSYARDAWISTQLRTKLFLDKDVLSINYSVDTVDQVVYLMGIAQSQAELDRVVNYARSLAYVKKVVNYVLLKDDPRRGRA
jgi:osmotically-inducible protein OsmY